MADRKRGAGSKQTPGAHEFFAENLSTGLPRFDFSKALDCRAYWLWVQQIFGEGSRLPWHIFRTYPGGLEGFARAGISGWRDLRYLTPKHLNALQSFTPEQALYKLNYALQMGWDVLTPESEKYPAALRNISDPPAVLYVQGNLSRLEERPWVALAGARKAGEEGAAAARRLAHGLSSAGAVVVSGVAQGVDTAALEGAAAAGVPTISVLPVDLSSFRQTDPVLRMKQVEMGSVVVTEYFSQPRPLQGTFQQRNRVITGMCQAVVLVQVGEKGGSMIYARHAAKQNRRLFVYPGAPDDPAFAGSRRLIAEGAQALREGWELFEAWPELFSFPKELVEQQKPGLSLGNMPEGKRAAAPGSQVVLRDSGVWQAEGTASQAGPAEALPADPMKPALPEEPLLATDPIQEVLTGGPLLEAVEMEEDVPETVVPADVPPEQAPVSKEDRVLDCLNGQSLMVEELSALTGIETGELLRLLFRMEMTGKVARGPGGQYRRG